MKKIILFLFLGIILNSNANENVSIASDPFPPYTICKMGEIPKKGLAVDIAKEIFSRIKNVDSNYMPCIPWKRVLYSTEQGKVDVTFPILKNEEREKKYYYSDPVMPASTSLFYLTERFPNGMQWEKLSDLNNKRICVVDGWSIHTYLEKEKKSNGYTYEIVPISGIGESCLNQLIKKRIDFYATNITMGIFQTRDLGLSSDTVKVVKKPLYTKKYYMAFSKKSEAHKLLPLVNKAIKQMREDAMIEKFIYGK